MSDRVASLTVILDREYRTDDVEAIQKAVEMVKGVQKVVLGPVVDVNTYYAQQKASMEYTTRILRALKEPIKNA